VQLENTKKARTGLGVEEKPLPKARVTQRTKPVSKTAALRGLQALTREPKRLPPHLQKFADGDGTNPQFKSRVDFNTISTNSAAEIAGGVGDTLNKYGVQIDNIGYLTSRKVRLNARYARYRTSLMGDVRWDSIEFSKTYVNNPIASAAKAERGFAHSITRAKAQQEATLKHWAGRTMPKEVLESFNRTQLYIDNAKQWTVAARSASPLRTTAIHESYHAVYYQKNLAQKWSESLKKNKVTKADKYKVSEYAASKDKELFAEVGAAIDTGVSIPSNVKAAFESTVRGL
jgi:hypothetical protein